MWCRDQWKRHSKLLHNSARYITERKTWQNPRQRNDNIYTTLAQEALNTNPANTTHMKKLQKPKTKLHNAVQLIRTRQHDNRIHKHKTKPQQYNTNNTTLTTLQTTRHNKTRHNRKEHDTWQQDTTRHNTDVWKYPWSQRSANIVTWGSHLGKQWR